MALQVTEKISIPESELRFDFVHSGGPGGQKVNKTSSAVVLRFDAMDSPSLPDDLKDRLSAIAGSRMNDRGEIVIHSRKHRSQSRNRDSALRKLVKILRKASGKPKRRKKTKPTRSSVEKRLEKKRARGSLKRQRSYHPGHDDTI
jgi:ribosome-associated protein